MLWGQVLALHMPGRVFGGFEAAEDARQMGKRLSLLPGSWCCLPGRSPQPYTLLQVSLAADRRVWGLGG